MSAVGVLEAGRLAAPLPLSFTLDVDHEAHEPIEARGGRRDDVRLLVSPETDEPIMTTFRSLPDHLQPGDLAVVNTSATVAAALDVVIEGPELRVGIEVLDTIHSALLHTLRNAVDHGIEAPSARVAAGKSRRGNIAVRISIDADSIGVMVQDDGSGMDTDSIRRRAQTLGLLSAEDARTAPEAKLFGLAFAAGAHPLKLLDRVADDIVVFPHASPLRKEISRNASPRAVQTSATSRQFEQAHGDPSVLALTLGWIAVVRSSKDQVRIDKIQTVLGEIGLPLALVPLEPHAVM